VLNISQLQDSVEAQKFKLSAVSAQIVMLAAVQPAIRNVVSQIVAADSCRPELIAAVESLIEMVEERRRAIKKLQELFA
jgi:hypothetical protein